MKWCERWNSCGANRCCFRSRSLQLLKSSKSLVDPFYPPPLLLFFQLTVHSTGLFRAVGWQHTMTLFEAIYLRFHCSPAVSEQFQSSSRAVSERYFQKTNQIAIFWVLLKIIFYWTVSEQFQSSFRAIFKKKKEE